MSDVHLDRPDVLLALTQIFDRTSSGNIPLPYAILMCGSFNSIEPNSNFVDEGN